MRRRVLITGMSGTGKSSVLDGLARHGWTVVDTDYGAWKIRGSDGDLIWDEVMMDRLLSDFPADHHLAVGGCMPNQGRFYDRFDAVILLYAPIDVMLDRVVRRTSNPYGKTDAERAEIRDYACSVLPLLRAGADLELDTSILDPEDVADAIEQFVAERQRLST